MANHNGYCTYYFEVDRIFEVQNKIKGYLRIIPVPYGHRHILYIQRKAVAEEDYEDDGYDERQPQRARFGRHRHVVQVEQRW